MAILIKILTINAFTDQPEADMDRTDEVEDNFDDWIEQGPSARCFFCPVEFLSQAEVFGHCHQEHGFNIVGVKRHLNLDFYNYIKFVNYIRKEVGSLAFDLFMRTWMDGWTDGWMDERMDGWMDGWMNGWMNGRMDGWMNGRMDGWMDEWMATMYTCVCKFDLDVNLALLF